MCKQTKCKKQEWERLSPLQGMEPRGLAGSYGGTWMITEIFIEIGHSEQMKGQASEKSTYFMLFPGTNSQLKSYFYIHWTNEIP